MTELRTVEKLNGSLWGSCKFEDLKIGDYFRLFEPDGCQVFGEGLSYMWKATSEVYVGEDTVGTVDCEPIDPIEEGLKIIEITGKV